MAVLKRSGRFRVIAGAYWLVFVVGAVVMIASAEHSWSDRVFEAGMLLGFVSMAWLMDRWRNHGSTAARNWLAVAFGAWIAAVFVGTGSMTTAYPVAGAALTIAVVGAVVVLVLERQTRPVPTDPADPADAADPAGDG